MKFFNFLFSCLTIFVSLNGFSQNKNSQDSNHVSSYENDKNVLNEKLGYTNKIWDSLNAILRQRPSDTIYRNTVRRQFKANKDQQLIEYRNFISENPNSLLSAETLNNLKFLYGKELTQDLFRPMPEKIKISQLGLDISNFIQLFQNPKINEQYIDFELTNQNGEKIKLSEQLGTYTLIDFWASWCGPCRASNPELVKMHKTYKDKGFIIIGVSIDDEKTPWTQAIEKDSLVWINVSDLKGQENTAALKYGITGVPTNFLINEKGIIIAKDIDLEALEALIK